MPNRPAGFAATLSLHERLLQLFLRCFYNANLATPRLVIAAPPVSADIFLSLPEIHFRTDPASGMFFDFHGWGPFALTSAGSPGQRRVKLRTTVRAQARVAVAGAQLVLSVDTATLEITALSIDPYSGGLFNPAELAFLQSTEFKTALLGGLRAIFIQVNALLPPFSLEFIGMLAADPKLTARLVYAPEALLVGLDVDNDTLSTEGNLSGLADHTAGNEIGVWVGRHAVEPAYRDVRDQIEEQAGDAGAELDSFRLVPEQGWLAISGTASKSGANVVFSLKAIPRLIRPGRVLDWHEQYGEHFHIVEPSREELWFETTDIQVDIERPWWAVLAEIVGGTLTLGIGFLVVEGLMTMIRGNIVNPIDQNEPSRSQRNRSFTLAGVTRPAIQLRLEEFESHPDGVYSGVRIRAVSWWTAELQGPEIMSAEEALTASLRYKVTLPPDALASDPELRVAWTIRRGDTNAVVLVRNTLAEGNLTIDIDNALVPFLDVKTVAIEVHLYRVLGAETDNLFSATLVMLVRDYVDRSHPFVRWSHQAVVPVVRKELDGSQTIFTHIAVGRNSAIHRTAIPGRCRMLRNHSLRRVLPADGPSFKFEYLDALPFPVEEIAANRDGLCDYCFFGGPTRSEPLI